MRPHLEGYLGMRPKIGASKPAKFPYMRFLDPPIIYIYYITIIIVSLV